MYISDLKSKILLAGRLYAHRIIIQTKLYSVKTEIMFDMERHPWCFTSRYFRRSFFQTIRNCVPRARCIHRLCTFMHLPSSYLLPASLWNTFRHTDLYENKGKRWGSLWRAKTEFRSAVERFREEEYFLPLPSSDLLQLPITKEIERVR